MSHEIDKPMTEHQLAFYAGFGEGLGAIGHKPAADAIFWLVREVRRQ